MVVGEEFWLPLVASHTIFVVSSLPQLHYDFIALGERLWLVPVLSEVWTVASAMEAAFELVVNTSD